MTQKGLLGRLGWRDRWGRIGFDCARVAVIAAVCTAFTCGLVANAAADSEANTHTSTLGLPARFLSAAASICPLGSHTSTCRALRARQVLGARLFVDPRLSGDGTISCASCHVPEKAFSDGRALAIGIHQVVGVRNTPSLINVAWVRSLFWDGRRPSLEQQAADPLLHPSEHGLSSVRDLERILLSDATYRELFSQAFLRVRQPVTAQHAFAALAAFERTLVLGNSPFDRFQYEHDASALSASAQRGYALFTGRARCASCHVIGVQASTFSDEEFHALGVGLGAVSTQLPRLLRRVEAEKGSASELLRDPDLAVLGRFLVTRDAKDIGAYRTPSLRNVALTSPYMHDGSVGTLAEAVEREVLYRSTQDGRVLILTPEERSDLVAFLEALTSPGTKELAQSARQLAGNAPAK